MWRSNLFTCVFLLVAFASFSQRTELTGTIFEEGTTQPLSFAKLFFKGTQVGTTTDTLGKFTLSIISESIVLDTVIVSLLGFNAQQIPIVRNTSKDTTLYLKSSLFLAIDEITVKPGENPAWFYMRKIIENKEQNNADNLDFYSSKEYSKVRFDLNNFTDNIKKNILLKPFDYIWENTNTTDDGVKYLPVLLTENVSQHYYRKSPKDSKDLVVAEKTTGLAGPNLTKFTKELYFTPNIYENFVTILDKSFPSPLNDNYQNNYKFYLMDSVEHENGKNYKIRFRPKHKYELAFTGEMYFDSASYAITEINLRFDIQANVNFVRSYFITQKYDQVDGIHWLMTESQVLGDFTVLEGSEDMSGFFGRKKAVFMDYKINQAIENKIFKGIDKVEYRDDEEALTEQEWEVLRKNSMSKEDTVLMALTERVKNDPAFKSRKIILTLIGTGYIPLKGFQIGDVFTFYNYNPVEFSRYKFGLRSDPKNKIPISYSGYLAYGTRDKVWKYEISGQWNMTPKSKATRIGVRYQYDIQQVGRSFNFLPLDHFFMSINQQLFGATRNYVRAYEAYLEKEIVTGFVARAGIFNKEYEPTRFHSYSEILSVPSLLNVVKYQSMGLDFTLKFSHLDPNATGGFYDKKSLYKSFRKYPELALNLQFVNKNLLPTDVNYTKLKISVRQKVRANKLGYFMYNIDAAKTWGTVPFMFLDAPFGNQFLLNDNYAFNLMNFMEYLSDQSIVIHLEHHFDGLILDRIPLINKLKWRGFVFGKAMYGSLSDKNSWGRFMLPIDSNPMVNPYYEVGFGIENIFKFAKIDFIWRPTPGLGEYYYFMVKPSLKFSF